MYVCLHACTYVCMYACIYSMQSNSMHACTCVCVCRSLGCCATAYVTDFLHNDEYSSLMQTHYGEPLRITSSQEMNKGSLDSVQPSALCKTMFKWRKNGILYILIHSVDCPARRPFFFLI